MNRLGQMALHYTARLGELEVVKWLVKHGVDINEKGIDGMISLHEAAIEGVFMKPSMACRRYPV
jgi:ankyrin repeat protein